MKFLSSIADIAFGTLAIFILLFFILKPSVDNSDINLDQKEMIKEIKSLKDQSIKLIEENQLLQEENKKKTSDNNEILHELDKVKVELSKSENGNKISEKGSSLVAIKPEKVFVAIDSNASLVGVSYSNFEKYIQEHPLKTNITLLQDRDVKWEKSSNVIDIIKNHKPNANISVGTLKKDS
ncbi:hypothetical protein ACFL6P_09690 [Candidatus Latescibacterota bacterium]